MEGGNRNRVQIDSGPNVTEQQIRWVRSLETGHFILSDWAWFQVYTAETNEALGFLLFNGNTEKKQIHKSPYVLLGRYVILLLMLGCKFLSSSVM